MVLLGDGDEFDDEDFWDDDVDDDYEYLGEHGDDGKNSFCFVGCLRLLSTSIARSSLFLLITNAQRLVNSPLCVW